MFVLKHALRRSTFKWNNVEPAVALKRDPLAVRRPGWMVGIERRKGELKRLGSIDARAPQSAVELVLVGHPLPVPGETQVPRRNASKIRDEYFSRVIVANQFASLLVMHQDNFLSVRAESRFIQPVGTGVQLQGSVPAALVPGSFLFDQPETLDVIP